MSKIVISYRREDTAAITGRIYDRLRSCFGDDVFRDLEDIPPGIDFRTHIREALLGARVLIAIVGPRWVGPRNDGLPRISAADDPVRVEIETALQIGIHVIPVLVNGAVMPQAGDLPASIASFAFLNAVAVDQGRDFHHHVDRLIAHLQKTATGPLGRAKLSILRSKALLVVGAGFLITAITAIVWLTIFDQSGSMVRDALLGRGSESSDVEIAPFKIPQGQTALEFLRFKVERNFVDLFTEANLRVRSALTTNQVLARSHYSLAGRIVENASDQTIVEAELQSPGGVIVGTSQIEGARAELEEIYKVIPEALMYGMAIDPSTLKKKSTVVRPTESIEAYARFLEAKRQVRARKYDVAERQLRRSIEIAPDFAMAYWAMGEINRLTGHKDEATKWYGEADSINPDHPKLSIEPATESHPVPALLSQIKLAGTQELETGAAYKLVRVPEYEISMHVFAFDAMRYRVKVVQQSEAGGDNIGAFLRSPEDVLAVNGGFFDIDSRSRLSPSGLLVVDRTMVRNVSSNAGSGVVFVSDASVGIVFRKDLPSDGVTSAVQSGPLLVDPGRKMGIYRNDFDRENRTAVCLRPGVMVFVVVEGGLSLFELAEVLAASPENGGIGCDVALNLDGGPSTQAILRTEKFGVSISGRWRLQNALVVYRSR
jgi:uncharacterized protein YigE (DUF2233 family)